METKNNPSSIIDKITAESVIIEIVDQKSGKTFRRNLPISYLETENGIVLSGETIDGSPSQINFFSDTALTRMNDLFGKGLNTPKCKE